MTTYNYANPNYTSWKGGIDPEFARAKAVRHGLKKLGTNQNERRALNIVIPKEKTVIIDTDKDMESDEITHSDYTDAEIISSTPNTNPQTEMPDANAL